MNKDKMSTQITYDLDVKGKKYDDSTYIGQMNFEDQSNILPREDKFYAPKSFIMSRNTTEMITDNIFDREYSASFNITHSPQRNQLQNDYLSNVKRNEIKKNNLIIEIDSKAEESNNFTFKKGEKGTTLNNSIHFNSKEGGNDVKNDVDYKHFNGEKTLIKHSLKKNKTPKFFISPQKCYSKQDIHRRHFNNSNLDIVHEKGSFLSINKDTITKYQHLFCDVEETSVKSTKRHGSRFHKNTNHLEDGDLTSLQKHGTVYSTSKNNTTNITESDMKKSVFLLTDSGNNLKDYKI